MRSIPGTRWAVAAVLMSFILVACEPSEESAADPNFGDRLYTAFSSHADGSATLLCRQTRTESDYAKFRQICDTWLDTVQPLVKERDVRNEYMDSFATSVDMLR